MFSYGHLDVPTLLLVTSSVQCGHCVSPLSSSPTTSAAVVPAHHPPPATVSAHLPLLPTAVRLLCQRTTLLPPARVVPCCWLLRACPYIHIHSSCVLCVLGGGRVAVHTTRPKPTTTSLSTLLSTGAATCAAHHPHHHRRGCTCSAPPSSPPARLHVQPPAPAGSCPHLQWMYLSPRRRQRTTRTSPP